MKIQILMVVRSFSVGEFVHTSILPNFAIFETSAEKKKKNPGLFKQKQNPEQANICLDETLEVFWQSLSHMRTWIVNKEAENNCS